MRASTSGIETFPFWLAAAIYVSFALALRPAASQSQGLQDRRSIFVAVVTDTAGRPLPGAEVQLLGSSLRRRTDESGRVALVAVPAGNAVLRLRRLGFIEQTVQIVVMPGTLANGSYKLVPIAPDLKRVLVRASELKPDRYASTTKFDDFYRRRSEGYGTFLTREDIDARQAPKSEDLIRMVSGVRIRYRGMTPSIQFLRCDRVNVYIDGIRSNDAFRDYFALSPLDIEAIEVYHGIATVPPEFSPQPNDCAAIVVWTRWHGSDN